MSNHNFKFIHKQLRKHTKHYKEVQDVVADILTKHPEVAKQNICIMKSIAEVETKRSTLTIERSTIFFVVYVAFIAFLLALAQFANLDCQTNIANFLHLRNTIIFSTIILSLFSVYKIYKVHVAQKNLIYYEILKDYCKSGDLPAIFHEPCSAICKYDKQHCHIRSSSNRVRNRQKKRLRRKNGFS